MKISRRISISKVASLSYYMTRCSCNPMLTAMNKMMENWNYRCSYDYGIKLEVAKYDPIRQSDPYSIRLKQIWIWIK